MKQTDIMEQFAKFFRIEVEHHANGWHGVVIDKTSMIRFVDPRPFPTNNGAVLATRATALEKWKKSKAKRG